ncbi:MAG: dihydroorotate dehydrogenase electron transfer subunit [Gammaproteobacteria bacterium]|nr:dihydroorotate dehydrogenase electron transfer subunit [Gammaproteobacteria bacterium]MCP4091589.1 dihydroorotate dehydrogenase electron transfer subunit [Gammaproteobacteria bacterium]MCP4276085.1 dihydroorotate dehydrogenase electron transfer subunit [Gammaproteobacteria bacterium]MCP4832577.1 dihydroorotate dehydrogenase electron transfer subunit [Gammaproteobacteria bacterium]MCP4929655.1 dihydroorotate dehydrogenase electron transfer subunit [Gammaproteobacteria bacterium]
MTASNTNNAHRNTIFVSDAQVIEQHSFSGDQHILRVAAPECAQYAVAGSFAHIRCDTDIPMRRPLSIMRANKTTGEVDFLYKVVGTGLRALSHARPGDTLNILGPIGNGFNPNKQHPRKLMIGGGVGMPPIVFLSEQLHQAGASLENSLVLLGSEVPFPFKQTTSAIAVQGIPDSTTDSMPELESIGAASRLASLQDYTGCYQGYVTDLAAEWLEALPPESLKEVEIFACGPEPMLKATAKVAAKFSLACQLCLEEFMACAVGGCAGCAVPVYSNEGMAMKRVCVDGPVFEAHAIYPEL